MDSKKQQVFWTKAEREIPTSRKAKSPMFKPLVTKSDDSASAVLIQTPIISTIDFTTTNNAAFMKSNVDQESKIGIKDLCSEDKARIANLIKELAKKDAENEDIKKCLESERELYEKKSKEILEQQDKLLKEKEMLLLNFAQKQEKLEKLLTKKLVTTKKKSSSESKQSKKDDNNVNSDLFLVPPKKSSTPQNCSPRSISPILRNEMQQQQQEKRNFTKEIDSEIIKMKGKPLLNSTIINENNHGKEQAVKMSKQNAAEMMDDKKQQLMQQRIDLVNEQKVLKHLIDQQERLLKEKNDQIMLQQKLHRERLEQLIAKKNEQPPAPPALSQPEATRQQQQLTVDFTALNINHHHQAATPHSVHFMKQNLSIASSSSSLSKLKQENSFDIFDLVSEANSASASSAVYNNNNNKRPQQPQHYYQTTTTVDDDDDETKLFEEIFFVN